jgi:hypothetical protein
MSKISKKITIGTFFDVFNMKNFFGDVMRVKNVSYIALNKKIKP